MRLSPALLLLAAACGAFEPEGDEPFTPPAEYRPLWDTVQACVGRRLAFGELRFMVVEGHSFDAPGGRKAGWTAGRTITLASDWVTYMPAVKHEMIHALGVERHVDFPTACHAWMGSGY